MVATCILAVMAFVSCSNKGTDDYINELRPSAFPLVTIDPYMSLWSFSDELYDKEVRHWTGMEEPVQARLRVDGEVFLVMGKPVGNTITVVPSAKQEKWDARYIKGDMPDENWYAEDYDDSSWNQGQGGFGAEEKTTTGTCWNELGDIYIRRTFDLSEVPQNLVMDCSHDEEYELYINGKLAASSNSYIEFYETIDIPSYLKPGRNVVACHCHNGYGAACIDFGFLSHTWNEGEKTALQTSVNVLPTRTLYNFRCGTVDLELVFTTPLLMDNFDIMSRPVSYISYNVTSNDGKRHDVQFMLTACANLVVDSDPEPVFTETGMGDGFSYVKCGTVEQRILAKKGDNVRIDWGHLYLASKDGHTSVLSPEKAVESFTLKGDVESLEGRIRTDNFIQEPIASVFTNNLGSIKESRNFMMIAYDDAYSVQYFWRNLRPYWNRSGDKNILGEIALAASQYDSLMQVCKKFDNELMERAEKAGGRKYAELCAVAYRQAIAAHKLVESPEGEILFLSKENYSNGSIGTVDVTYPSSPLFLLYNPKLAEGLLNHIFYFSESGRWTKPFAAHDVGTYPIANGQTYGGDMPVEESGNMLILTAAIAKAEGNADYAAKHWETLTTWAGYLAQFGLDPEEQLCTDDFAGHFAHNANLSIKAILGLGSYAKLAQQLGYNDVAEKYTAMAKDMAAKWKDMANDGDHYRLTFDKPGTWSQKYNLVWDGLLDLNLFDPSIAHTEIAYYLTKMNKYGLPLDSRKTYTKLDWIIWTATMTENSEDFQALIEPIWNFENDTPERLPMSDWVETVQPTPVGFRARSVVGGVFIPLLKTAK